MLNGWRRIKEMISDDRTIRHRQVVALSAVGLSIPVVLFSGLVGSVVISGNPQHERAWTAIAVAGLAVGFALAVGGNLAWQLARMRDTRTPGDGEPKRTQFTGWQWAEIGLLIVLLYGQIALIFTVLKDRPGLALLVGLVPMLLMAHMYSWLIPLWRQRQRTRGG